MITKLCVLLVLLDLSTLVRVPVLPGWVVPLPVLLVAAGFLACAAVLAGAVLLTPRAWVVPAASEAAGEARP